MTDMSISGAAPSLSSTVSKSIFDQANATMTLAANVIAQTATKFGPDMMGLRERISALSAQNPALAEAVRGIVTSSLSPLQAGELLSGRTYGVTPSTAGADAAIVAKPASNPASPSSEFAIPKTPAAAPKTINFSPDTQAVFNAQWKASFPGGTSKEQGATITFDKKAGTVSTENIGGTGSTSGSFSPDLNVKNPKTTGVLGIFHTHPYDKSEGGFTGVSLSGGDAGYMINGKQNIIVAQSGAKQFMYMRTAKTPASVDFTKLNDSQNARIAALVTKGYTFDAASRVAASETATKYGLAYYEGSNGTLTRVNPK